MMYKAKQKTRKLITYFSLAGAVVREVTEVE